MSNRRDSRDSEKNVKSRREMIRKANDIRSYIAELPLTETVKKEADEYVGERLSIIYELYVRERRRFERSKNIKEGMPEKDSMTGLIRRGSFEKRLVNFLKRERRQRHMVFMFIDVAEFKRINDTLGHFVGDDVLRVVANIMRNQTRNHDLDILGRWGGDEFVCCVETKDCEAAQRVCERFRDSVKAYEWRCLNDELVDVTLNIGGVCFSAPINSGFESGEGAEDAFKRIWKAADVLMLKAKDIYKESAGLKNPVLTERYDVVDVGQVGEGMIGLENKNK